MTFEHACWKFGYAPGKFIDNSVEHGPEHSRTFVQNSFDRRTQEFGDKDYGEARDAIFAVIKLIHDEK